MKMEQGLVTEQAVEESAYESLKELLDTVFEQDGLLGVIHASINVIEAYDKAASEAQNGNSAKHSARTVAAAYLLATHIPTVSAQISAK